MANKHSSDVGPEATLVSATETPALLARVSWGAIFSGAVVALGLLILLGLLGTAFGFRAIDPQQSTAFDGVGVGAGIWWIVTSIIALAVGGYVAGHLSGIPEKRSATAHGASVWGLLTIAMLWLGASTTGAAINTATGAVTGVAEAAATAARTGTEAILEPGGISPETAEDRATTAMDRVENEINQIDEREVRAQAAQGAEDALDALSSASWYAFFASLLSLVAAVMAAGAGAPRRAFMTAREKIEL